MSTALPRHVRRALRASVAAATVLALGIPGIAQAAPPVSASAPDTPWTSVSDVLAESLQRMQAASARAEVVPASPAPAPPPAPAPRVLATVDGVELVEPSTSLSAIGFHEGATTATALTPVGRAVANDSWIDTPPTTDGPDYRIMPSRGRDAGPTTAVDLALPEAEQVRSVVTGTVVNVQQYALYGETTDLLIEIVPEGHTDLKVQLFHMRDARVAIGDRVTAGETVVADHPRQLPFGSQIDRFVGHAGPHVHAQVVRA